MKKLLLILAPLLLLPCSSPLFSKNDIKVVFSPGDEEPLEFAASEFAKYASKLTGSEIGLLKDDPSKEAPPVLVIVTIASDNVSPALRSLCGNLWSELPASDEGFLIHTDSTTRGKRLFLIGRSPRAAVYAVYHYLERHCRVGFFKDYVEYIPEG